MIEPKNFYRKLDSLLNKIGQDLGNLDYVHAMTDVTGFGVRFALQLLTRTNSGTNL